MSYLNKGPLITDKNKRKYTHKSIIPFPVCADAAINKNRRKTTIGECDIK